MPKSQSSTISLPVRQKHLSRALITVLRSCRWDKIYVDDRIGFLSAELNLPRYVGSEKWNFEFRANIRWREDGLNTVVEINVSEHKYEWAVGFCVEKVKEIASGLVARAEAIVHAAEASKKGARWASRGNVASARYYFDRSSLGPNNLIICPGPKRDSFVALPEDQTCRHAIVCGPTGSSKSTGIFEPNLLERVNGSAIVTEATGSKGYAGLYERTAGYRASCGQEIFYFNPDDLRSHRINPISFVETHRDARRLTEIIMKSTTLKTHKGDQSWELSEKLLLTALILHATSLADEGKANFGHILELANQGPDDLQSSVGRSRVEAARTVFAGFLKTTTEGYRNLVFNGIISRLALWNDPVIKALTETTDIDFYGLKDKLFTIYLAVPAEKSELKPLSAMILNLVLELSGRVRFSKPLALYLDEFTNFGFVSGMPQKLTILRHDKIPALLGVQDYIQLQNMYAEEAKLLISQPGTRIFFKPNDFDTAEHISKMLGVIREEDRVTSAGQLRDMKEKEPLLAPDDLLNLGAVGESENDFEAGRPKLIAFLPAVRPIRECALTYRDYQSLTDGSRFRPPFRPLLEVDERLVLSDPDDGEELCGEIELGDENPENPDYEDTNEDDLQDPEELAQIRDNERLSSW